jgi:hypothetical protein
MTAELVSRRERDREQVEWTGPGHLITPEPWMQDARCAQVSPDDFFPEKGDRQAARDAKKICGSCPVRAQCLEFARRTNQRHGIWGGVSMRTDTR